MENKEEFNINFEILKHLSIGLTQLEVSNLFKKKGIKPNSTSIIDKRLKAMRDDMGCTTVFEMMYKVGSTGILKDYKLRS